MKLISNNGNCQKHAITTGNTKKFLLNLTLKEMDNQNENIN